jgi:hypothetical protein
LAMVLIMLFKPKGILSNRDPTIKLHGDKKWAISFYLLKI